ncbi:MAG TPA: hypothetical protein VK387_04010 [Thermoleophilaceae bacterium]|nr:hypothetical protein [Thermoleophilaceae bacterium]
MAAVGPLAGLAGGLLGASIARALDPDLGHPGRASRWLAPAAGATAVAVLAFPLLTEPGPALRAEVTLAEARPAPHREVKPTVRIDPSAGADGADWMSVLAWQGRR